MKKKLHDRNYFSILLFQCFWNVVPTRSSLVIAKIPLSTFGYRNSPFLASDMMLSGVLCWALYNRTPFSVDIIQNSLLFLPSSSLYWPPKLRLGTVNLKIFLLSWTNTTVDSCYWLPVVYVSYALVGILESAPDKCRLPAGTWTLTKNNICNKIYHPALYFTHYIMNNILVFFIHASSSSIPQLTLHIIWIIIFPK